MANSSDLLTGREVCKILRIGDKQLRKLRRSGKIKFIRLGKRTIRYHPDDVEAFIDGARFDPRPKTLRSQWRGNR